MITFIGKKVIKIFDIFSVQIHFFTKPIRILIKLIRIHITDYISPSLVEEYVGGLRYDGALLGLRDAAVVEVVPLRVQPVLTVRSVYKTNLRKQKYLLGIFSYFVNFFVHMATLTKSCLKKAKPLPTCFLVKIFK